VKSKAMEHAIAIAAINAIFSIENPASIKNQTMLYQKQLQIPLKL
jgi:hypothetical protein